MRFGSTKQAAIDEFGTNTYGAQLLCDRTAHISIYLGSWLSGAELRTFPHNNVKKLETLLHKEKDKRRRVILVDGQYSADGDFAPLKEITELAQEHKAQVIVDEAHSFGAIGLGVAVSNWLMDHGIFVHPHVPAGEGRLRIGVTSTHTQHECALLVDRLTEAKNKFSL